MLMAAAGLAASAARAVAATVRWRALRIIASLRTSRRDTRVLGAPEREERLTRIKSNEPGRLCQMSHLRGTRAVPARSPQPVGAAQGAHVRDRAPAEGGGVVAPLEKGDDPPARERPRDLFHGARHPRETLQP